MLHQEAIFRHRTGEHDKAENLYKRALAAANSGGDSTQGVASTIMLSLSSFYLERRRYAEATKLLDQSLPQLEKLGAISGAYGAALENKATIFNHQGDQARALPLMKKACAIAEKAHGKQGFMLSGCKMNLATIMQCAGDYAGAKRELDEARTIRARMLGAKHPKVAQVVNAIAALEIARGDIERGIRTLEGAADTYDSDMDLLLRVGSEKQKRDFFGLVRNATHAIVSLHAQKTKDDGAALKLALRTVLRRKGRVLDALSAGGGAIRGRLDGTAATKFDELQQLRTKLSAAMLGTAAGPSAGARDTVIASLSKRAAKLDAELNELSAGYRASSQPVDIERVRQVLPAGSALVEIFAYRPYNFRWKRITEVWAPERYVAYVLPAKGPLRWADLGPTEPIDALASKLRESLADPNSDPKPAASALDDKTMRLVAPLLPAKTTQLFLSPDGALNLVPFGALQDDKGRYRIESATFTYLASGRDLLRLEAKGKAKGGPLVIANPAFDAGKSGPRRGTTIFSKVNFTPLSGTAEEADAIGGLLADATVLTQDAATEDELKKSAAPSVLHVATHGFFLTQKFVAQKGARGLVLEEEPPVGKLNKLPGVDDNPLIRSGLALAGANAGKSGNQDGVLTALEASGLDLWGTEMVVLSACETGLGEVKNGDGVYGLRRALVIAGSRTQVMSLWKVDDDATRDLMVAFYGKLIDGGERSAALRDTQLALLAGKYKHPYYWAAFIPSGDWRSLKLSRGTGKPAAKRGGAPTSADDIEAKPGARGCSCEAAGSHDGSGGWWAWLAAGAWMATRRYHRQRCNASRSPAC